MEVARGSLATAAGGGDGGGTTGELSGGPELAEKHERVLGTRFPHSPSTDEPPGCRPRAVAGAPASSRVLRGEREKKKGQFAHNPLPFLLFV